MSYSFTPEFAQTLKRLGINLGGQVTAPTSTPSWESKIDYSAPFFTARGLGINPGNDIAAAVKTAKQGTVTPAVQKLYDSIVKMRNEEAARGAASTAPHKGWWQKAIDIVSRPGKAVEGFLTRGATERIAQGPATVNPFSQANVEVYKKAAGGAKEGFTKGNITGLETAGAFGIKPTNPVGKFAVGLGMDIATDPLSYVGFGVGKHLVIDTAKLAKTNEIIKSLGTKLTPEQLGFTGKILSPTGKAITTESGIKAITTATDELSKNAGKLAQESLAANLTKVGFKSNDASFSAKRWLDPRLATDPKILGEKMVFGNLLKTLPETRNSTIVGKNIVQIFEDTKNEATKTLTEVLNANLEQQVKRTLNVKAFGLEAPIAPIPQQVVRALNTVSKAPVLNGAIKTFNKTFNTGSKLDHEFYINRSRAAGKAEQQINLNTKIITKAFTGIHKNQRVGFMKALVSNPNFAKGVVHSADGTDLGNITQDLLDHYGRYIDWTGKGGGIVSLGKLNAYLPHNYRFDIGVIKRNPDQFVHTPDQNFLNLFRIHKEHLQSVDPQDLFYHIGIGIEKSLARDQVFRAIRDMGISTKPVKMTNPLTNRLGKQDNAVTRELIDKHGYVPIYTKTTREFEREVDPAYNRYLKDRIFHPEIKAGLVHMIRMMDDEKHVTGIMRTYDKALGYFKKAVTLPNPGYHIRNSVGDLLTSYTDGVAGPRGLASYAQAAKVVKAIHPVSKDDEINRILTAPVTSEGKIEDPIKQLAAVLSKRDRPANLIMKKNIKWKDIPGNYVTAEQFMAAYQHTGLKRGFVATDLEHELKGNPNIALKMTHNTMQSVLNFAQNREDYFRMAHFIDRIKRSRAPSFEEAAKEAAYYVKKFHFDYTDVTPTERLVFARLMPFYKFQRFATPLMMQMFFASPGKILNAQKVLNNMSQAAGYDGGFLPTADMILPEYMHDAMMLPLFQTNRGSTAYFGNSLLPSTSIFSQTLGLESSKPREIAGSIGQNIIQNATPGLQIPAELYFGKRTLGKGQIPVQSKSGSYLPYAFSKLPISNVGLNKPFQQDFSTAMLNFLTGLGVSENTPQRQMSELYREKDVITSHRKQSGYKKPKSTNAPPYSSPGVP